MFAFRAKELQLGFLKLLRGTSLRNDANEYGYIYQKESPYEMIENKWLSQTDVHNIHIAEDMLEKYWNSGRFVRTMNAVMDEQKSAFYFFYHLGCFYEKQGYKKMGYQLDELFSYLDRYLQREDYHELLIQDYLSQFKVKPKEMVSSNFNTPRKKRSDKRLG
ncbi:MAG: DUF4080 domain-containing protein [Coprobacillus cateniformis]